MQLREKSTGFGLNVLRLTALNEQQNIKLVPGLYGAGAELCIFGFGATAGGCFLAELCMWIFICAKSFSIPW